MKQNRKPRVTERGNSPLDKIVQTVLPYSLVNFLNRQIVKTDYVYLNIWSAVHFCSGILFFFIWSIFSSNFFLGFFIWLAIHTLWELLEFLLAFKGLYPALFHEEFVDSIWDTIVSLAGYAMIWLLF